MYKITFFLEIDRDDLIMEEEIWPHLPCVDTLISFLYKDHDKNDKDDFEAEDYLVESISHAYPRDRSKVFVYLKEL